MWSARNFRLPLEFVSGLPNPRISAACVIELCTTNRFRWDVSSWIFVKVPEGGGSVLLCACTEGCEGNSAVDHYWPCGAHYAIR